MKKRRQYLAWLIALVMIVTSVFPAFASVGAEIGNALSQSQATSRDVASSSNAALMYREPSDSSREPVEDTNKNLLNSLNGIESTSKGYFFYYLDSDGKETRLTASQLKTQNSSVVEIEAHNQNSLAVRVRFRARGTTEITYTVDDEIYSVKVSVSTANTDQDTGSNTPTGPALMYREPSASNRDPVEDTNNALLDSLSGSENTSNGYFFYYIDSGGKETRLTASQLKPQNESIVGIEEHNKNKAAVRVVFKGVGTTVITYTVNNENYSVEVNVSGTNTDSGSGSDSDSNTPARPALMYRHARWKYNPVDGTRVPEAPTSQSLRTSIDDLDTELVIFYYVDVDETTKELEYDQLKVKDEKIVKLIAYDESPLAVGIEFVGIGKTEITYTVGDKEYAVLVDYTYLNPDSGSDSTPPPTTSGLNFYWVKEGLDGNYIKDELANLNGGDKFEIYPVTVSPGYFYFRDADAGTETKLRVDDLRITEGNLTLEEEDGLIVIGARSAKVDDTAEISYVHNETTYIFEVKVVKAQNPTLRFCMDTDIGGTSYGGFYLSETENTFYFLVGSGWEFTNIQLDSALDKIADFWISDDGSYVAITVEEIPEEYTNYEITYEVADSDDSSNVRSETQSVWLRNTKNYAHTVVQQETVNVAKNEIETFIAQILAAGQSAIEELAGVVSERTINAIKAIKEDVESGKVELTPKIVSIPIDRGAVEKDAEEIEASLDTVLGSDAQIAQYLNIEIKINRSDEENENGIKLGTINKLSEEVDFSLVIPEDLEKEGRKFYILRLHDGLVEKLEVVVNEDGSYSFSTDRFSTYLVAYEDLEVNPDEEVDQEPDEEVTEPDDPETSTDSEETTNTASSESEEVIVMQDSYEGSEWTQDADGTWYLTKAEGSNALGWAVKDNKWYYLDPATGKMQTGWQSIDNKWYFLSGSGAMETGWILSGNSWYYLNAVDGDMLTGWQLVNNKWYYLEPTNGNMLTGWQLVDGIWYYMTENGDMLADTMTPDGYLVGPSGAWIQ